MDKLNDLCKENSLPLNVDKRNLMSFVRERFMNYPFNIDDKILARESMRISVSFSTHNKPLLII